MTTETLSSTAMHAGIKALRDITVEQLKHKYREVFGQSSRSNHKHFRFRRMQANADAGAGSVVAE